MSATPGDDVGVGRLVHVGLRAGVGDGDHRRTGAGPGVDSCRSSLPALRRSRGIRVRTPGRHRSAGRPARQRSPRRWPARQGARRPDRSAREPSGGGGRRWRGRRRGWNGRSSWSWLWSSVGAGAGMGAGRRRRDGPDDGGGHGGGRCLERGVLGEKCGALGLVRRLRGPGCVRDQLSRNDGHDGEENDGHQHERARANDRRQSGFSLEFGRALGQRARLALLMSDTHGTPVERRATRRTLAETLRTGLQRSGHCPAPPR